MGKMRLSEVLGVSMYAIIRDYESYEPDNLLDIICRLAMERNTAEMMEEGESHAD